MATSVPLVSVLGFCSLALVVQGVILVTSDTVTLPCLTDDPIAEPDCRSLAGGFFDDVGSVLGFFVDGVVFFFRFVTFDLVPALPWFFQFPLAVVCGGSLLFVMIWLVTQAVQAIGSITPFP